MTAIFESPYLEPLGLREVREPLTIVQRLAFGVVEEAELIIKKPQLLMPPVGGPESIPGEEMGQAIRALEGWVPRASDPAVKAAVQFDRDLRRIVTGAWTQIAEYRHSLTNYLAAEAAYQEILRRRVTQVVSNSVDMRARAVAGLTGKAHRAALGVADDFALHGRILLVKFQRGVMFSIELLSTLTCGELAGKPAAASRLVYERYAPLATIAIIVGLGGAIGVNRLLNQFLNQPNGRPVEAPSPNPLV